MPQIRQYPQAGSILATDAFVIDRIGQGTMFVENTNLTQGFRASMRTPPSNPYASTPTVRVPYDTIDFDTTGGFSLTQVVPTFGTFPAFKVPTTGIWRFETATQFFDQLPSSSEVVSTLQASNHVNSIGATVEFFQYNSPPITVTAASGFTKTFSVGFSFLTQCSTGDFLFINSNLESAATSSTLQMLGGSSTLCVTYFSGTFVR